MAGGIVIVVVLVVVIPVAVLIGCGVIAGTLGFFMKQTGEVTNEGSELIDLNR
jgi:hypothetical protein